MDFKIVKKKDFSVCGIKTELTTSQKENYKIIRDHWQKFNKELRIRKVKTDENWNKYGVYTKIRDKYFYLTAIPKYIEVEGFETLNIRESRFAYFQHTGSMNLIKSTIHAIYKNIIPAFDLKIDKKRTILHYEHYDYRFRYNRSDSVIDIYVPLDN